MKKSFIIIIILCVMIAIFGLLINKNKNVWKKVNIGKNYCESEIIELDLNGDNIESNIIF